MPIYEYQCKSCGHELEAIQKMSEAPLTFCPECGQPELSKRISAVGFRLKGGGWYETDFKKDSDKKKNLAGDGKSESSSSASSASGGDAGKAAPSAA
jgi:putative FmdB family regulatory protein